jgi:hypothetical protein
MTSDIKRKEQIGKKLREWQGPRATASAAETLGVSSRRLRQMQNGKVPESWLRLVKLAQDGVDLYYLLGVRDRQNGAGTA